MVNFRRSLGFLSLISFVYNVTAAASSTAANPSPTEVVVPLSQVEEISDSTVIDDPTLIENLFSPIVNSTDDSTLLVERSGASDCKCYPGQACWPAQSAWDLLNLTLSGQLIKYVPAAAPCHNSFEGKATYNAGQCAVINGPSGWTTEEFHVADPGSTVWEFATGNTCLPTSDPTSNCTRGNYPVYVINATCPAHIQIGVTFTRLFNIRLIIKNTGHDFLGKSLGYGSLSIWTHNLQQMSWINKYTGPGGYTGKAVKLGAGVTTKDIYQAASARSQVIVGGECERVGFAGGYIQGGGHGPHTPIYGMAADQGLSVDIVLASGAFVTASPSSYADLFWAVMGGGGGTFGIVTSVTVKTYPDTSYTGAIIQFGGQNNTVFWEGVHSFHKYAPTYAAQGLYAYYEISNLGSRFFNLKPLFGKGLTVSQMNTIIAPFLKELAQAGITPTVTVTSYPNFYAAHQGLFDPETVGYDFIFGSRFFSKNDMVSKLDQVNNALQYVVENGYVAVSHIVAPNASVTANNAVNPMWRTNVLFPIISTFMDASMPASLVAQIVTDNTNIYTQKLRDVTPGWGTYLNEADMNEPNFQSSFYGTGYQKLYAIKQKYDPTGVFYAKTAVGSEDYLEMSDGRICSA